MAAAGKGYGDGCCNEWKEDRHSSFIYCDDAYKCNYVLEPSYFETNYNKRNSRALTLKLVSN